MHHIAGCVGYEDLNPVAVQTFVGLRGDVCPLISDCICSGCWQWPFSRIELPAESDADALSARR
jgi:hypothetical protein